MVAERAPAREEYLRQVRLQIEEDLRINKIKGAVTGRPKHYYSIYQKMIVRGKDFDDIYDLVAVRVIVDTVQDCYAVLGSLDLVDPQVLLDLKAHLAQVLLARRGALATMCSISS